MRRLLAPALAWLALAGSSPDPGRPSLEPDPPLGAQERFDRLAEEYLSFHLYFNPVEATLLGVHDYDGRLPDLSQDGIFGLVASYHGWLERLLAIDRKELRGDAYWDHQILELGIRGRLLELEELRSWERNPLFYLDRVARGLAPFASPGARSPLERMRAAEARERQIPELLARARSNLLNPPRVLTELALEKAAQAVRLVRDELPGAFEGLPPGDDRDRFQRVNQRTIEELRRFAAWLEEDLLPRSRGDPRLGPTLFQAKLRVQEHVEASPEALLALAREESDRYRRWIESEAQEVDASRPPEEVIRVVGRGPLPVDSVLSTAERQMRDARDFVIREDLLTLPASDLPRVRAMPPHRPTGPVSLAAPGPLGSELQPAAFYEIELPDPGSTDQDAEARLDPLAPASLLAGTVRETYPGRYIHSLYLRRVPSRIRRTFRPRSLDEGWSLYAQEMMVDRGFGSGDPMVRIAQLRQVLVELSRLRVGLLVHWKGAPLSQGARIFREAAYLDSLPALREARRAASDPASGAGSVGMMQLLKLRADYQEYLVREGETYVLGNFHDRFLRLGAPVEVARRILIPGDQRPSLPDPR